MFSGNYIIFFDYPDLCLEIGDSETFSDNLTGMNNLSKPPSTSSKRAKYSTDDLPTLGECASNKKKAAEINPKISTVTNRRRTATKAGKPGKNKNKNIK